MKIYMLKILLNMGILYYVRMGIKKISESQKQEIYALYSKGFSSTKIGKVFNVAHSSILRLLKKNNIKILKNSQREYNRKYFYDFDFLTKNSEELAYMMGFMFADGCLIGKRILTCQIKETDKERLLYFCSLLKLDQASIKSYKRKYKDGYTYSSIFNIVGDFEKILYKWGIVNRKTYNFIEPQIEDEYIIPFILGIIDGDGSINIKRGYSIKITGNKFALNWIKNKLKLYNFNFENHNKKYPDRIWDSLIMGKKNDVINFAKQLNIVEKSYLMPRKWSKLKQFIQNEDNNA